MFIEYEPPEVVDKTTSISSRYLYHHLTLRVVNITLEIS
jgi:hypothetical protein